MRITSACASLGVDGLRGDLVTARAAIAHAAWRDDLVVTAADVREAARLALPHRRRRGPFDDPGWISSGWTTRLADRTTPTTATTPTRRRMGRRRRWWRQWRRWRRWRRAAGWRGRPVFGPRRWCSRPSG